MSDSSKPWGVKAEWDDRGLACCDWVEMLGEHVGFYTEAEARAFIHELPPKAVYGTVYTPQERLER